MITLKYRRLSWYGVALIPGAAEAGERGRETKVPKRERRRSLRGGGRLVPSRSVARDSYDTMQRGRNYSQRAAGAHQAHSEGAGFPSRCAGGADWRRPSWGESCAAEHRHARQRGAVAGCGRLRPCGRSHLFGVQAPADTRQAQRACRLRVLHEKQRRKREVTLFAPQHTPRP